MSALWWRWWSVHGWLWCPFLPCAGLLLPSAAQSWCDFCWRFDFSKTEKSLHREAGASETARGRTAVMDPAAAACSDAWVCLSLGCHAGWPGQLGQAAVLSGNSYFCHCCTDFQVFPARCTGVSVDASQQAMSKRRCPVVGWRGAGFIQLQLGETSFPWLCRWYPRHGVKIATDVVEMPKHS